MFNQKFILVLCKVLAWSTLGITAFTFLGGFFLASSDTDGSWEAVGYLIGYEGALLFIAGSFYLVLATIYRLNSKV